MKKFTFYGVRTLDETFYIDIEADSLEEAEEMLEEGDYEEYGHRTDYVDGSEEFNLIEDDSDEEETDED